MSKQIRIFNLHLWLFSVLNLHPKFYIVHWVSAAFWEFQLAEILTFPFPLFVYLLIQSFIYINMDSWIFVLFCLIHYLSYSFYHFLFRCPNCLILWSPIILACFISVCPPTLFEHFLTCWYPKFTLFQVHSVLSLSHSTNQASC